MVILVAIGAVTPGTAAVAAPIRTGAPVRTGPSARTGAPALVLPVSWAEFRGTFDGALTVERFAAAPDLTAVGRLQGRTNSRYGPEQVDQPAAVPVLAIAATRRTLHLELGPLDPRPPSHVGLHLDRFSADITPRHLGPAGRRNWRHLRLALARGAPAGELAELLNLLLPELACSAVSVGTGGTDSHAASGAAPLR
jgi:hypothetical protein